MSELIEQLAKKINALPRYSFLLNESGGVKRWENSSGDWIDRYEVVTMIDNAIESYQAAAPIHNVAPDYIAIRNKEGRLLETFSNDERARVEQMIIGLRELYGELTLIDLRALIPDTQAYAQTQGQSETGWLVENGKQGDELRYRTMANGWPEWTADHNEAIRFARRIDADRFAAEDEDAWRVVEHTWSDAAPIAVDADAERK
jgi:hypothetical protein